MYVCIDPADREEFVLYLSEAPVQPWKKKRLSRIQAESLLQAVVLALQEEGAQLADIKGVAVCFGKGSFTADRVAVTTVNMLSLALKIPVTAIEEINETLLGTCFEKVQPGQYITARYSGPPNVGHKKE